MSQLRVAAFSDVGLVRSNNQDGGYASPSLLVLADGMGGAAAGDVASSVTVGYLALIDNDVPSAAQMLPRLRTAIDMAHHDLIRRSEEDPSLTGMGTTCIAVLHVGNKLAMVHVGDSRAYVLHDGELTQVTHDHTLVQYLVDHGQLTPQEAEHHPKRNVIMRALGDTPGPVELDESIREAVPSDRWLLCSDGLFGVVARDTIHDVLADTPDLAQAGETLISLALAGGAPDNVTVVLADVVADDEVPDTQHSQAPIIVGSAAEHAAPTRGADTAAGKAALLYALRTGNSDPFSASADGSSPDNSSAVPESPGDSNDPEASGRVALSDGAVASAGESTNAENQTNTQGSQAADAASSPVSSRMLGAADTAGAAPRRRKLPRILAALGALLVIAAGLAGAWAWTQTRYYVATSQGKVAIYRGIPQSIGPVKLSELYETLALNVSDLTPVAQERLATPITRGSLESARQAADALVASQNDQIQTQSDQIQNDQASESASHEPAAPDEGGRQ
ncbi:MAG: protein phosphatase 2C domain-containing protein [Actinomycetaceae bacterium]|nr:protein phosphatase 2C domain-containing protein [Actinomycetaceae bacterium]MDY6082407.1 protein phosphatase 2C domain-containing protein [Actinomycetaceae bacterium]